MGCLEDWLDCIAGCCPGEDHISKTTLITRFPPSKRVNNVTQYLPGMHVGQFQNTCQILTKTKYTTTLAIALAYCAVDYAANRDRRWSVVLMIDVEGLKEASVHLSSISVWYQTL